MKSNFLHNTKTGFKALAAGLFLFGAQLANAQCTASISATAGAGGVVNFQSVSTGTTISTYYSWNFGGGSTAMGPTASHTYTSNGWKYVCLTIISNTTSMSSCTNTVCDSVLVTTIPTTVAPCQANFNHTSGANGSVSFANTSTGTTGSTAYSWTFGDGSGAMTPSPAHTYTANGYYIACLTIVSNTASASSCTSTACDTVWVTNSPTTPTCQASFVYTTGANGLVNFASTSTGTTGSTYYSWSFGGGANGSGIAPAHTYTSNGSKMVCLTIVTNTASANSCTSTVCDTIHITNVPTPTAPCSPTVMYTLSKDSIVPLTWNAYPAYPANVTGATWTWGDGSSSTGLYPTHTYSAAGVYSTCVTISVSCSSSITATYCYVATIFKTSQSMDMITINVIQNLATGISAVKQDAAALNIYPNPNSGEFTLELNAAGNNNIVSIYNLVGEKVFEKQVDAGKQTVDVSSLSNGTYLVNVATVAGSVHKKITIQK